MVRPFSPVTTFWKTPPILRHIPSGIFSRPVLLSLWVLALGTIAFLWHLGSVGLVDETEPLFAEAARQMIVRQDWVTPYFNEVQRFDKPPLIYWLMALCYQLFGVNEWSVRLPSALSAIVLVAIVAYTLVGYGQPWGWGSVPKSAENQASRNATWGRAVWGSAMLAFCGEMLAWGRVGVSDMLLNACMGCSLLCFFQGYAHSENKPGRGIWYFAAYTWVALAVLAKGPIGLVLPGLIILAFLIYIGQFWTVLREMQVFGGLVWICAVTIPWYVLVIQANGDAYIQSFFGYHNFERFTRVVNNHGAPWYFYFLVVLVGFAPWSLYLPPALYRLRFWQWKRWRSFPRQTHLGIFAFFWFIGVFGFFTIAVTKLPSYVLPLMPAAAILVALYGQEEWTANSLIDGKNSDGEKLDREKLDKEKLDGEYSDKQQSDRENIGNN
ncbi:MAG: ArnT family glycosyltransferase, partial [Prochlorotrichaceae cyanobacterium]